MRETRFKDFYNEDDKDFTTKTVVVEPGTGRAVGLGLYPSDTPEPDFALSFNPNIEDDIGVAPSRLDIPDEHHYLMVLQVHNFSAKKCTITIRRVGD